MKKTLIIFWIDILAAALILLTIWIINYKIPQKGIQALPLHKIADMQQNVNMGRSASGDSLQKTEMKTAKEDWSWSFYQMKVPGFVGKISLRIQGLCVYNEYIVKDGIFS